MIQINVVGIKQRQRVTPENLLLALNNYLDSNKFFGTIQLKYEAGVLKHVDCQQKFTVDTLVDYLNS